jgi:hypothetical protein
MSTKQERAMRDIRGYEVHEVETTSNRSKLMGAAVVALGIGALGVFAFASGDSRPAASQQMASNQIRTTPEGAQQMPAPVTPPLTQNPVIPATPSKPQANSQQAAITAPVATPLDGTPLDPKPAAKKEKQKPVSEEQVAAKPAVKSMAPMAAPAPDMTPPENAQPTPSTQPAAIPEAPVPQETPAPTETPVPPQGQ